MKGCELCDRPARMYCESDQASLCWGCDAKVHSANFLVARHSRSLLCQTCQEPTSWRAAGGRLSPTVSVCQKCVSKPRDRSASDVEVDSGERPISGTDDEQECNDDDDDLEETEEEEEEEDEEVDEEEEEDADNQVVPWTSSSISGPVASTSSEEETSSRNCSHGQAGSGTPLGVSLKRGRENEDSLYQEGIRCSLSQATYSVPDKEAAPPAPSGLPKPKKASRESDSASYSRKGLNERVSHRLPNEGKNSVERATPIVDIFRNRLSSVDLVSDDSKRRPM